MADEVRTGRLVDAAKAAASAASVGYAAAIAQAQGQEAEASQNIDEDEMGIMYQVLMMQFSPQNEQQGLTLDILMKWDQVQDLLDAGFIDENILLDIFKTCADETEIGLVISKNKFPKFAERLDIASDAGIHKSRGSEVYNPRESVDIGNVVNNFRDPGENVDGINNVMVSTTKLELSSPQAHQAKGIAALIQNAPRSRGRLVAAAAAAAAAASLGASKACGLAEHQDSIVDEMEVLFSVLMSGTGKQSVSIEAGNNAQSGLTLQTICQWNAIQNILESGVIDESLVSDVFGLHAEVVDGCRVIKKQNFRLFAENIDSVVNGDQSCLIEKNSSEETRTARTSSLFNSLADLEAMCSSFEPPKPPASSGGFVSKTQLSPIREPDKSNITEKKRGTNTSPMRTRSPQRTTNTNTSPMRTRSPQRTTNTNTSPMRTRSPQRTTNTNTSPMRTRSPQRTTNTNTSPMRTRSPQRTKSPVRKVDMDARDSSLKASIDATKQREKMELEAKLEADRIARGAAAKERMESRRAQSPVRTSAQKSPTRSSRDKLPANVSTSKSAASTSKSVRAVSPKRGNTPQQSKIDEAIALEKEAEQKKLDADREGRRLAAQSRMEARKAASPVRGRSPQRSPNRARPTP